MKFERRENETVSSSLKWKPHGKRPRGRPRKRWINVVEENLKVLGVWNQKRVFQDRDTWRSIVLYNNGKNSQRVDVPLVEEKEVVWIRLNRPTTHAF